MRLAVLSDVHANLPALEAVLADIRTRAVDATVNLGDCAAGPLWPRETWECLEALNLPTVRGNHDRYLGDTPFDELGKADRFAYEALTEAQRRALGGLPATVALEEDILAVHGTPSRDTTYLTEDILSGRMAPADRATIRARLGDAMERAVVLCGHSHRQSVTQIPGGPLILNPGTVGCPVFPERATAAGLEYRSPHARYAILTRRAGRTGIHWNIEMFALDYDWDHAAARARENRFPKWAEALASGAVG